MATDIPMPSYSDNMEEADLVGWLVAPGDFIHEGDPIAEIETDKATGELESPVSGTLVEICVAEGTMGVKVGAVVARIDAAEAEAPPPPEAIETSASPPASAAEPIDSGSPLEEPTDSPPTPPVAETPSPPPAFPSATTALARRVAEQSGLDLSGLRGTGARGRITKADVEAAASGAMAPASRALAVLDVDCDVSKALDVCRQASEREDPIELVAFAVRAAVLALNDVPDLAARPEREENGFAVRVHAASGAPKTLQEAERKSLGILAQELRAAPEETTEAPDIEIFDFGGLGIHRVQAPVAAGGTAALGIGAPRPIHADGDLDHAHFTLSVDTSRVKLATAAHWFSEFRRRIEDPLEMLL